MFSFFIAYFTLQGSVTPLPTPCAAVLYFHFPPCVGTLSEKGGSCVAKDRRTPLLLFVDVALFDMSFYGAGGGSFSYLDDSSPKVKNLQKIY